MKILLRLSMHPSIWLACLCVNTLRAEPVVSMEHMLNTTLSTWTEVDTIRSIARNDRPYLYPRLIKANLDLYATTYWFTAQQTKSEVPSDYCEDIEQLFTALTISQKDTVSGLSISDNHQALVTNWVPSQAVPIYEHTVAGLVSCMIMDQTKELWHHFLQKSSVTTSMK